jgi:hypothetical protein
MENSGHMSTNDWRPPYWQYAALAILFFFAVGFRILATMDYVSSLEESGGGRHFFVFFEPGTLRIAGAPPSLRRAGIQPGDELVKVNGRTIRNFFDLTNLPENVDVELVRAGETIHAQAALPYRAPPSRDPRVPVTTFILQVLIPAICLGMGFWLLYARATRRLGCCCC